PAAGAFCNLTRPRLAVQILGSSPTGSSTLLRSSSVAAVLLFSLACSQRAPQSGSARISLSGRNQSLTIDHVTLTISSQAGLFATHGLRLSDGAWQTTFSGIPVGTYSFAAAAYSSPGDTAPSLVGEAHDVPI